MSCLIAVHCFTDIVNFYVHGIHFLGFGRVFSDWGALIGLGVWGGGWYIQMSSKCLDCFFNYLFFFKHCWSYTLRLFLHVTFYYFVGFREVLPNCCCCESWPGDKVSFFNCDYPCIIDWISGCCMKVSDGLGMDGNLYMLCVSSCLIASSVSANTVKKIAVLLLHPWRTGGSLVVMVIIPFLWMVTPSLPRWKTVV